MQYGFTPFIKSIFLSDLFVCLCVNCTDARMKVLDIIEECQSDARKTPKDNAPAVGKYTSTLFPNRLIYPLLQNSL